MSHLHCIITRFSYRFKEENSIEHLLSDKRLEERIRLFKKYCFPSIINQNNNNFYWIIIIDPLLPEKYKQELQNTIDEFKNSDNYLEKGPREIFLHTWNFDDVLGKIDWFLPYLTPYFKEQKIKYLITTRLDDDDSLIDNFIDLIKNKKGKINGYKYISYFTGYQHYSNEKIVKLIRSPLIALGLTLIADIEKYPICVYMGRHTEIPMYVRKPQLWPLLHEYTLKNKDYPITKKDISERLLLIRRTDPVYIRNVHNFNLQKNIQKNNRTKSVIDNKTILKRFNIIL